MTGLAIDIRSNVKQVSRWLDQTQKKQVPFAVAGALNDVAFKLTKGGGRRGVNSVLGKEVNETFNLKAGGKGASNYTRTGFRYDKARKSDLTAYVEFDPKRGDYMEYQTFGGIENPTRKFLLIPHRNRKSLTDRFGNLRPKMVDDLLANKQKFFEGKPKGFPNASNGIWERMQISKTNPMGKKIRMVAAYVPSTGYRPLFEFSETVDGFVFGTKGFDMYFQQRLRKALQSARR